ncbi:BadF/BadG/BcrA/BcrD ATPase family protein [Dactylosporangium sp. NPDC051484]|uniref:N-acetylglucosamine kinase n=1 Tax=Dactylosporangium sp. NPDC051484 TaxID=3154942 RepID=UPI00344EF814
MRDSLVIGVDAGATTTRCVLSDLDGNILARGSAGGANQNSSGAPPGVALASALREAIAATDPARVALGVIGAAGAGTGGREAARAAALEAWRTAGLSGRLLAVTDLEVGFAAGTPAPDGLLLLAGTGAVAAAFAGGVLTHRCDGYGWLLGDEGSAVWLGRKGLRAVMRALDGRGPRTDLAEPLSTALGVPAGPGLAADPEGHAQRLLRAAFDRPPAALGALAPVVSDLAAAGDPVARGLAAEAAGHLLHALATVARRAGPDEIGVEPAGPEIRVEPAGPGEIGVEPAVVLAGSVLLSSGPVAERVRAGVRERFGREPVEARDGAAGAAWLAISQVGGAPGDAATHARLTRAGLRGTP